MSETLVTSAQAATAEKVSEGKISEQGLKTSGQRRINLIWETTQMGITFLVIGTAMYTAGRISLLVLDPAATERTVSLAITAFVLISNATFLVLGFYFGRTNHQRMGGVGAAQDESR
jgi:hypothetical protein